MFLVPKEKPLVGKLNSYYVHIGKLFEHYQGELGTGAIHFKSPFAEAVIYFDKDEILNGIFEEKGQLYKGTRILEKVIDAIDRNNFTIWIYEIPPNHIHLWANVPDAQELYRDLSTEFSELGGLLSKMKTENLTGFINVCLDKGNGGGVLFFNGGQIVGGSFSWGPIPLEGLQDAVGSLITKSKEQGATFFVYKIVPHNHLRDYFPGEKNSHEILSALEELLSVFEGVVNSNGRINKDFRTLLKKKFLEKADQFEFLDPFAGEFEYKDGKITFVGEATDEQLAKGLIGCVKELATELHVMSKLLGSLGHWYQQYKETLSSFGIKLY